MKQVLSDAHGRYAVAGSRRGARVAGESQAAVWYNQTMRRLTLVAVIAVLVSARGRARADDLEVSYPRDLPIIIGGGFLYVLGETVFKDELSPSTCRWCSSNRVDESIRDGLRWSSPASAHTASSVTGFVLAPVVAVGAVALAARVDGRGRDWLDDGLIVVESAVIASTVNYAVKAAVGRERPFVHYLPPADKVSTYGPEYNLSFYSGHSTLSMSLAVSAGYVATVRGSRLAPLIWTGGVGLSLATGYLRIAADRHWASDVMVGWVTGAATGYLVPRLLHQRRDAERIGLAITPRSVQLSLAW